MKYYYHGDTLSESLKIDVYFLNNILTPHPPAHLSLNETRSVLLSIKVDAMFCRCLMTNFAIENIINLTGLVRMNALRELKYMYI